MSRPQRTQNLDHDPYYTPAWATKMLVDHLKRHGWLFEDHRIYEPCAGDGAIVDVLQDRNLRTIFSDIRQEAVGPSYNFLADDDRIDAFLDEADWVITNPPYQTESGDALDFVERARLAGKHCAFLLRESFIEPTWERGAYFKMDPPEQLLVLPRVDYNGPGGGDGNSETSIWFIWQGAQPGVTQPNRNHTEVIWKTRDDKEAMKGQTSLLDQVGPIGLDNP